MLLALPTTAGLLLEHAVRPALAQMEPRLTSDAALVWEVAFAHQETTLRTRHQYGGGPGRGLWQFEEGDARSRAGCTGLFMHPATQQRITSVCLTHQVRPNPQALHAALERDDLLAAKAARLLMFADAFPLPLPGDHEGGWDLYLRTWNPGRPRPEKWQAAWRAALSAVIGGEL